MFTLGTLSASSLIVVWLIVPWAWEMLYQGCKPSTKSYIMVVQFSCQAAMQCSTLQAMNIIIYRRWDESSCWKVSTSNDKKGETQPSHFPALLNQKNMITANLKFQVSFLIWGTPISLSILAKSHISLQFFLLQILPRGPLVGQLTRQKKTIICRLSKVVQP